MGKKLKISELNVESFITDTENLLGGDKGGGSTGTTNSWRGKHGGSCKHGSVHTQCGFTRNPRCQSLMFGCQSDHPKCEDARL